MKLAEAKRRIDKLIELDEPFDRMETTIEQLDSPRTGRQPSGSSPGVGRSGM
jgi:hypothetical protein